MPLFQNDKNGNDLLLLDDGDAHRITFRKPSDKKWDELHVAHTHPDTYGGTFSISDMYFVTDSGVLSLAAVCQEGTYLISRGENPKAKSLMRAYDVAYQKMYSEVIDNQNATKQLRKAMHSWLFENAGKYGFEYTFKKV